jgi:triosephosphate isomerase (TIM)
MSRRKILAGNWKMNQGPKETHAFFEAIAKDSPTLKPGREMRLYLPYLSLETGLKTAPATIRIGAQNAHWEQKGAFTGEISGPMLREAGIEHVLIGHSERRPRPSAR